MGHGHGHGDMSGAVSASSRYLTRMGISLAILVTFLVLEVVVGLLTSSLALLSDAAHMLTDVLGVAMAMAAIVAARRSRATPSRTFGLYRLEVLAALGNAVLLFGVAGWILYEAVERFVDPPAVSGLPVMLAAAAGLVANLVVFLLLRRGARESIRAGAPSGTDAAVALFHSLSDATRLAIVRRLAGGEARVADLVGELGLAQSTVSAHVGCLRDCGLVTGRPQGRQVFYSLVRPELLDLLRSAEALLAVTGERVALCPNYGIDAMRGRGTGDE